MIIALGAPAVTLNQYRLQPQSLSSGRDTFQDWCSYSRFVFAMQSTLSFARERSDGSRCLRATVEMCGWGGLLELMDVTVKARTS